MRQKIRKKWGGVAIFFAMGMAFSTLLFAQSGVPKGPHGAALEEYQMKFLDKLQENKVDVGEIPFGVDEEYWNAMIPEGNETTQARIDLGRKLYFDLRLSKDGTVSCATCHDTTRGFGDALPTSEGIGMQFGKRNAPTTMNIALLHSMFWDGRSPTVEHQAMQPIINPIEMGMPEDEAVIIAGIKDDPEYQEMFQAAYGREINYKDIGNALAVFERTFIFMDSPFFRFLQKESNSNITDQPLLGRSVQDLSEDAYAGWLIFNREGRCNSCHQISPSNPLGTDNKFHNIGIAAHNQDFTKLTHLAIEALAEDSSEAKIDELALSTDMSELGRFLITKNINDMGAFRTPMLLNIGITGPYMHDGSFKTLWDVVDHYNKGGIPNLYLDGGIEPLNLTEEQVNQLVAFLFSLTDVRFSDQNINEYRKQADLANQSRPEQDIDISTRKTLSFENFDATSATKGNVQ